MIRQAGEVMERYRPDGLFMDIVGHGECVCPRCLASMQAAGLDPTDPADRAVHDRRVTMEYYRTFTEAVWSRDPDMHVFHNSGHIYRGERDRYRYFSHLEIESLPTGGWGYDHFPVAARYVHTLGMEYLGMTGKFHTTWGEFGGYKRPEALEYECALMAALGARCSIGDQLHPSGAIDEATYASIAPAYGRVKAMEPYLEGARSAADIAVLSSDAVNGTRGAGTHGTNRGDDGAVRMLLELRHMFDVIDGEADFSAYRLLVLPDDVVLDDRLAEKVRDYLAAGGALVLSGSSGMTGAATEFALPLALEYVGERRETGPDFLAVREGFVPGFPAPPVAMYGRSYFVKATGTGEVLATIHEPYFDRRWDHFCSHQHAPPRPEPSVERDAIVRDGRVVYFAHPIFSSYYTSGQPLYRDLVAGAIDLLIERPLVRTQLPAAARISLMRQSDPERLLLHLLYAQPQLRGRGHRTASGRTIDVEVIEDPFPLYRVRCAVAVDNRPDRVYHAATGRAIPFTFAGGYIEFELEKLHIHELVVIETGRAASISS
ncbi:MAG: beta-galactosidase trimerization domain-containing protein [Spirochaetales bacterium]|nr:beta-galactosidase trimerization domain-containing protein [Spirochaetales bacterium]